MTFVSSLLTLSLGLVLGIGCAATGPAASGEAVLTGEVTYRQRIALPPEAVVTVTLSDVSLADAPATVLATQTIQTEGRNVPIPFALNYDAEAIDARHTYAVRAEIRDASGALIWTTDTHHPVLTDGAPSDDVTITLVQVQASVDPGMPGGGAPTVQYTCENASGGAFSFTTRHRGGAIEVGLPERFGSRTLMLRQVAAASGVKYESDGVTVWTRGASEAMLEVDGETFTCSSAS